MNPEHFQCIDSALRESELARRRFFSGSAPALVEAARAVADCLRAQGKLLLFGNGGSAADAQHIAAEFVNKLHAMRPALAAIALTTDSSVITSVANDMSYDEVFARQLRALGRPGDVAIGITTSGNSPSVLAALQAASELGLVTIGLLGRDGGKARELCRHRLIVPHQDTQRIQEVHILIGHLIAELSEKMLEGAP